MVSAMSAVYAEYGVNYVHCSDVYGLTIGETKETLAALPTAGRGYLLAMDGQDYYGTSCAKENWVQDQLVTCWDKSGNNGQNSVASCKTSSEPLERLRDYVLASANNEATDDASTLGPPADLSQTPLNEIQALWQVDTHAITTGLQHMSSLLEDNRASRVNEYMVNLIYEGNFDTISLFAVDNVALHGNALLSVMRTACGQSSILQDDACGTNLPPPPLTYFHVTIKQTLVSLLLLYVIASVFILLWKRPKTLTTMVARLQEASLSFFSRQETRNDDDLSITPPSSSRREKLLSSENSIGSQK